MQHRSILAAVLAGSLLLAACGDDDADDELGRQEQPADDGDETPDPEGDGENPERIESTDDTAPEEGEGGESEGSEGGPPTEPPDDPSDTQPSGFLLEGACSLLEDDEIDRATGSPVAGESGGSESCAWTFAEGSSYEAQDAVLSLSLVNEEEFNAARANAENTTITEVDGIGDDAYHRENQAASFLYVLVGEQAFNIGVEFAAEGNPALGNEEFTQTREALARIVAGRLG